MITRRAAAQGLAAFALGSPALAAPAASIAMYKGPDRAERILAGAKTEGKVAFYSGMIENQALRPLGVSLVTTDADARSESIGRIS